MACDSDRTASRSSSEPHLQSALPQGNKLCREVRAQRHLSVATHQLRAKRTDAALGNRPDNGSTGGYMLCMVHADMLRGLRGPVNPIR